MQRLQSLKKQRFTSANFAYSACNINIFNPLPKKYTRFSDFQSSSSLHYSQNVGLIFSSVLIKRKTMQEPLLLEYFIAETSGNSFLLQMLLNALGLMVGARLISGVSIQSFVNALIVAVVLALLNATLGAFMDFVSTPLRWLTLGLFAFIVDALVIKVAAHFLNSFDVRGFLPAVYLAIALSLFNLVVSIFI